MPPESQSVFSVPEIHEPKRSWYGMPVFILLCIAAFAAISFVAVWFVPAAHDLFTPFAKVEGTIYLTLGDRTTHAADLYQLSVSTRKLSTVRGPGYVRYTSSLNGAASKIAYLSTPLDPNTDFAYPFTRARALISQNMDGESVMVVGWPGLASARYPSWSPDGSSLAVGGVLDEKRFADYGAWNIRVFKSATLSSDNDYKQLAGHGIQQNWSPDGKSLIYLGHEGIYQEDLAASSTPQLVVPNPFPGSADTENKIALSPDKKLFGWSNLRKKDVIIYRVTSWSPFAVERVKTLHDSVGFPATITFSPNGSFIAAIDLVGDTPEISLAHLTLFEVATGKQKDFLDLSQFDPDLPFVTDWR